MNPDERYWLDPRRALDDQEFAVNRAAADWREAVSQRFGNWLNARLDTRKTPMSDAEHDQWTTELDEELKMLREELGSHE